MAGGNLSFRDASNSLQLPVTSTPRREVEIQTHISSDAEELSLKQNVALLVDQVKYLQNRLTNFEQSKCRADATTQSQTDASTQTEPQVTKGASQHDSSVSEILVLNENEQSTAINTPNQVANIRNKSSREQGSNNCAQNQAETHSATRKK